MMTHLEVFTVNRIRRERRADEEGRSDCSATHSPHRLRSHTKTPDATAAAAAEQDTAENCASPRCFARPCTRGGSPACQSHTRAGSTQRLQQRWRVAPVHRTTASRRESCSDHTDVYVYVYVKPGRQSLWRLGSSHRSRSLPMFSACLVGGPRKGGPERPAGDHPQQSLHVLLPQAAIGCAEQNSACGDERQSAPARYLRSRATFRIVILVPLPFLVHDIRV
ncbi:hypothetical protein C0Q70_09459 [Pomacea canaliculata]|uniref:Uncharacterized protein n=1 Tax=Pomacea canaliculata TaxID=400727 RepID=A0A2T7P9V1_POMCA|nr:hypothetical protein C0Q70_09459 [Pomacea canaliculata]